MKALFAGIFAILALCTFVHGAHAVGIMAPPNASPGDMFMIAIGDDGTSTFESATFNGHALATTKVGGLLRVAFAGIDVAAASGTATIVVTRRWPLGDVTTEIATVEIIAKKFPEARVNRPMLSARDTERIGRDKEKIALAVLGASLAPLWVESFWYPVLRPRVSKGGEFGIRRKSRAGVGYHAGVDFGGDKGTRILAANTGTVILAEPLFLEGNCVVIDHGMGLLTFYMHLDSFAVTKGESVAKGQVLGVMGATGRVTGRHLHFSVTMNGARVDPLRVIGAFGIGPRGEVEDISPGDTETAERSSVPDAAPRDVRAWSEKAEDMLSREKVSLMYKTRVVLSKKKGKTVRHNVSNVEGKEVALATLTTSDTVRIVHLTAPISRPGTGGEYPITNVRPASCSARRIGGGGVNTNFEVICDGAKEIVLAALHPLVDERNRHAVLQAGRATYVPYSDEIAAPVVLMDGQSYVEGEIERAVVELQRDRVFSRAVPGKLVADIFSRDMVFRLGLIEHIDHEEFRRRGPEYTGNKALTLFGTNRERAYQYSTSSAGALCLMQIMPSTYIPVRNTYGEARMPAKPFDGSCGAHKDAIKMAYLVLDSKLTLMPDSYKKKFLAHPEAYGVFLAVAYNGGERRARDLYQQIGRERLFEIMENFFSQFDPREREFRVMREETWVYLKKYIEIAKHFSGGGVFTDERE
ncbi:MAG: hypothetical protein A3I44_02695 [Candidatus Sungbacteria bacterium RIFCSPLOWO2_02_FULL_51_17]|uniref:M23ase beta-sheet core domain-containing protein n=1 Tax=Candidatus Sungbacteria bacterium RIFCSPHIGHO2_02_FULL_51_29 TaxID=1802273 RepID=A0A1G2KU44_9BACT|nr:MAG: hypothetical protein A2676_01330 [Candidatus Sungbacteria bacterium RIFCSPHIGHO2_01_FULL_51_22]OHA02957.1 MAG: hypothetical protein A3C16_05805 [Candidatus Sungbacteria bacterium RIFCSPHIGHO2_02_FULL_51_29]OHA04969.1 MAG: hypothetical protein A3B29_00480 [Candidatus Sungbacteria bacterium RIFCSPLOWO2_01_FULL_51_34]OHA10807.1 MAG: hypothetical protein A3I44_02695 [Candidatus Sungbacteria bacterium RIFCSPLOWO2_02_FULL_51_17]